MAAFEELKKCLTTAPVLSPPIGDSKYILDTDASDEAVGAVLQQEQDGLVKMIAYASRFLQAAETILYNQEGASWDNLWSQAV